jgi:polyisoprenoid-binding protein YceI
MLKSFAIIFLAAVPLTATAAGSSQYTWEADLAHCRAQFMVSHMVVSQVWGHIPVRQLTMTNTGNSPIPQRIEVVLDVSHEDTDNHDRDADLRSPTYFDTAKYPTMTFRSTMIAPQNAQNFNVTGDLTIKNVTKRVSFPVHVVGIIPDPKGWRVGYTGSLTIDRRDWGIVDNRLTPAGVLLVGYSVDIGLTVEAVTDNPNMH